MAFTRYGISYGNDNYRPLSPFTGEAIFTHATQNDDHGSRRAGHGARNKKEKRVMGNLADDFGSMSISTEQSAIGYPKQMGSYSDN